MLKAELVALTQKPFQMYRPDRFIPEASARLKRRVEERTVSEVEAVQREAHEQATAARVRLRDEIFAKLRDIEARSAPARRYEQIIKLSNDREVDDPYWQLRELVREHNPSARTTRRQRAMLEKLRKALDATPASPVEKPDEEDVPPVN